MLTNAIFRVAAATEKILGLIGDNSGNGRDILAKLRTSKSIAVGIELPKAHEHLHRYPAREKRVPDPNTKRKKFLADQRKLYEQSKSIDAPLVAAIIQHDSDKHVPHPPIKDLGFDFELAVGSFRQACDVWDEAFGIHKAKKGNSNTLF